MSARGTVRTASDNRRSQRTGLRAEVPAVPLPDAMDMARTRLSGVEVADDLIEAVCEACARLGIRSLRAPLFAITLARAHAAMAQRRRSNPTISRSRRATCSGRGRVRFPPLKARRRHRRRRMIRRIRRPNNEPILRAKRQMRDATRRDGREPSRRSRYRGSAFGAAARLLSGTHAQVRKGARRDGKSGASTIARRRGRPLASRPGRLSEGRLDLLATLKAAVPWQALRTGQRSGARLAIRRGDIHIKRYRERSESLTIFVVDASGSTAAQRLAEAKGAVELLLAECYVRRIRWP